MDAQTPERPSASGVGTGTPLPREATDPGALTPLVPTGPPPVSLKRSRWRVVIVGFLAIVPLLCIGGIAFAFHAYDKATRPDRSTPAAVVQNYLQAFLVNRDEVDASQYTCANTNGLSSFTAFRGSFDSASSSTAPVAFSWGEGAIQSIGPDQSEVEVRITATATGGRAISTWSFTTDLRASWCVASAIQLT